jgi:YVTN family beta-propeller protein
MLAALLVLTGCSAKGHPGGPSPSLSSTGDPAYIAARVHMGHLPCGVVAGPERVWVSNYGDGTLQWIDPTTNQPGPPITVGAAPCGLALGAGSVWVENYRGDSVTRVNANTGAVQATIAVGHSPYDVTFTAGAAWVTDWSDGTVSRIDAATDRRTVIRTGGSPTGIVAVAGGLWVGLGGSAFDEATQTNYSIVRIDPTTSQITDRINAGQSPTWMAPYGNAVWISDAANASVIRIDGLTRKVVDTQVLGSAIPLDGDGVAGAVWIPDKSGRLYRLDPNSGKITGQFDSGVAVPFVISGSGSNLWAVDFSGSDVVRIDLTRLP